MEAQVFEQQHLARRQALRQRLGVGPHTIRGQAYRLAEQSLQASGHRSQAIRRINLATRAPEVGRQNHTGAFLERIGKRGQHSTNACIVRHLSRFAEWDVEIHPDKQALAPYSNVTQSSLGHQSTPLAAMTLRNLFPSV